MQNAVPFDFFDFFDMVTGTSATITEKFIAIVHARQIARRNGESYLSRSKAQAAASVSDNTYQRAMPVVRLFLQDSQSKGRATVWTPRPEITVENVEEAILAMRDTPKVHPKTTPQNGVYPAEDTPQGGIGMPQNGVAPCPKLVGHKEQFKEEDSGTSLRSVPAGNDEPLDAKDVVWSNGLRWLGKASGKPDDKLKPLIGKWLKTLTYDELLHAMRSAKAARTGDPIGYIGTFVAQAKKVEHSVRREHGRLVVMNGFKAELEQILAGRDLQRSLDQIGGKIPIGVSGLELEARVRGLAVEIVERAAEQDRRYAAAVAQNAREGPSKSRAERQEESARDWLFADLDSRRAKGPAQPRIEEIEW